ncbi:SDR family NAD(P)-dependent oxidoreductase [Echinimonas agarilytica]|uniref:SDR family NAD(P)-dependent oxidoreductase n=1 Tax=Echinimonas agarilytica TaxID=1215918 RepID=A0AA42B7W9_9GAMM|nr:SDR family NAD(P)-dependent oxidoreductase [Echinimonas agarilytica]MCM2680302.1 SDR family NAD(P)-dependent oxidoreductase [Echinimonas agarilytica]
MKKTILITGSTDGIGFETAKMLVSQGHHVLIHGRNPTKLQGVAEQLASIEGANPIESYVSDLSNLADVQNLADEVKAKHNSLDVLINNAGVYKVSQITTVDDLDVRFVVNTIAPYLLTQQLQPLFDHTGRIVNLSSAAQSPVDFASLVSRSAGPNDSAIYAQSKLALTMWSAHLAASLGTQGPAVIAVNPASFLGSKMVKEAYGVDGGDLQIGAKVLCRAALDDDFANASGKYFDNDSGRFTAPHSDALNVSKCQALVSIIQQVIEDKTQ